LIYTLFGVLVSCFLKILFFIEYTANFVPNYLIMTKNILSILALLVVFGTGLLLSNWWHGTTELKKTETSQVLLERIQNVCKLISVEGYFSEVYEYSDYWGYDISLFKKKALIRVKAKVSAGYDMTKMKIDTEEATKTMTISNIPEATILSIDSDLDYYDISEGTFNSFKPEELTKVTQKAKDYVRQQAEKSTLLNSAKEQGNKVLDVAKLMGESMGWKVVVKPNVVKPIAQ
jgi:hypothetical protein